MGRLTGPQCNALLSLCGCDGSVDKVYTGCGFPEGYASGPSKGAFALCFSLDDGGASDAADR